MTTQHLKISLIRRDGGTQSRAGTNPETVNEYADAMRDGKTFPAVTCYFDGSDYWLADGFHRIEAAEKIGLDQFESTVIQGARRDAILHSVGANSTHGLRRNRADVRRSIETLLRDPEWSSWSDREIARRVGCDHKTVAAVRSDLAGSGEIPHMDTRTATRNGTEYQVGMPSYQNYLASKPKPEQPAAQPEQKTVIRDVKSNLAVGQQVISGISGKPGRVLKISGAQVYVEFGDRRVWINEQSLSLLKFGKWKAGMEVLYARGDITYVATIISIDPGGHVMTLRKEDGVIARGTTDCISPHLPDWAKIGQRVQYNPPIDSPHVRTESEIFNTFINGGGTWSAEIRYATVPIAVAIENLKPIESQPAAAAPEPEQTAEVFGPMQPDRNLPAYKFSIGDYCQTRIGRICQIVDIAGRFVQVADGNRKVTHYIETLKPAELKPAEQKTVVQPVAVAAPVLPPQIKPLMDDRALDQLNTAAQNLFLFLERRELPDNLLDDLEAIHSAIRIARTEFYKLDQVR